MKRNRNASRIDWTITLIPLAAILALCVLFMVMPGESTATLNTLRNFFCNTTGLYYILLGAGVLVVSLYIVFSKFGKIRLGNTDKPEFSTFKWGSMIFTSTMAADILFFSLCEWALYAGDPYIKTIGGIQKWAPTYTLFHWGPIPWGFYIILSVAFGFMMHVRGRDRQRFSEACRPIIGKHADGIGGKVIDLIAVFALLAGTATTFSVATPLLSAAVASVFHLTSGAVLTIVILLFIAAVYMLAVLFGIKGISKLAEICVGLFVVLLLYVLIGGGEAVYILETGVSSLGNMLQNFISLSTWLDPLRTSGNGVSGFVQNWTIFYWAYWMVWCVATPFFIGFISKGRTIRNTIIGGYLCGLTGTYTSFIILGNYGLAQQMKHGLDTAGVIAGGGDISQAILAIFNTLPLPKFGLLITAAAMIAFYATTFDSLTLVVSSYSYKRLPVGEEPSKKVRVFWALLFILLPIALIFAQNSLSSLQSVSIIAAFPIGIVIVLIVASFFKDASLYLKENIQL